MRRPWRSPAIALLVLAPVCGELLPGWSPPLVFFNPLALLWWVPLYGVAALCIREIAVRSRRGLPFILLLGAAFGVVAEALVARTWFDAPANDAFQTYGRAHGLNWGVILPFCVFHAVYSVAIPIALAELRAGPRRAEAWIGKRALLTLGIAWSIVWLGLPLAQRPAEWAVALAVSAPLVLAALFIAPRSIATTTVATRIADPRRFMLAGFVLTVANFGIGWWLFSGANLPVVTQAAFYSVWACTGVWWIGRLGGAALDAAPHRRLALIVGALWAVLLQATAIGALGQLDTLLFSPIAAAVLLLIWKRHPHDQIGYGNTISSDSPNPVPRFRPWRRSPISPAS